MKLECPLCGSTCISVDFTEPDEDAQAYCEDCDSYMDVVLCCDTESEREQRMCNNMDDCELCSLLDVYLHGPRVPKVRIPSSNTSYM